jgi:putative SOS response-associated peptidase YedK
MIERYSLTLTATELAERFSVVVPDFYKPHYNAAPTQLLPVITSAAREGLSVFYWGTSPEWSKNKTLAEKLINVRREYFEEKPALKRTLMKARCIVPADGFYAWKKVGKKTSIPYRFVPVNGEPFGFAALWEEFEDTDGNEIQTFSIITVPSNPMVATVSERMPLVLEKDVEAEWLNPDAAQIRIEEIMKSPSEGSINFYPVSPVISNTARDLPSMILPTPPADQHGNLTLFD